ncbi:MAG: TetR/AcrR family transcriptional regulator [Proteobacteria bacterium]|nr:TetR/AcrR family transcriptional regulator [Pseudomonadota bacterium]
MATRKRRTPELAREEILEAAETRLQKYGLEGLNVADVAADCGMSHATVIHHFGNTAGMRSALVSRMTHRLLHDIIDSLQQGITQPEPLLHKLFGTLSEGGHARLLAWTHVSEEALDQDQARTAHMQSLFAELVPALTDSLPAGKADPDLTRKLIFLSAIAAIGYGIAGETLAPLIGLAKKDQKQFPDWFAEQINKLSNTP